jgi:hypothetical protein
MATAPVNLLLLNKEQRIDYENGRRTYEVAWGRRSDLETSVEVDEGTWYFVVEGSTETSSGRIDVFQ